MYQDDHETLRFLNRQLDNILLEIDRSKGEQDDFARFERHMNEERLKQSRERLATQGREHRQ
jgi:hypothetical protein